jgi:hypothetical protein
VIPRKTAVLRIRESRCPVRLPSKVLMKWLDAKEIAK